MNKSIIEQSNLSQKRNITKCNDTTNWKTMNYNASTGDILNNEIDEVTFLKREIKRLNRNIKLLTEIKRKNDIEYGCVISNQKQLIHFLQLESKDKDNLIDSLKKYAESFQSDINCFYQLLQNAIQSQCNTLTKEMTNNIDKIMGKYEKIPPYYDYTTSKRNWQLKVVLKEQTKLNETTNIVLTPKIPDNYLNKTIAICDRLKLNYNKKELYDKRNNSNKNMMRNTSIIYNRRQVTPKEFSKNKKLPLVIYKNSK